MRRVRRQSGGVALTTTRAPAGVVGVAPVTPLLAAPGVRHEQVSLLVLGETATLLASEGDWRRIRCTMDGYEGWAHRGYLKELEAAALERWNPGGWSQGAELEAEGNRVRLPLRALVGPDHRVLMPVSILAGAAFVVACDTVGRLALAPAQLPVGVVTALVGGPFFLSILVREKGRARLWGG